jgi:hypothetical protein
MRVVAVLCTMVAASVVAAAETPAPATGAAAEILKIHEGLIASHLAGDVAGILAAEADEYTVVSRGEIRFPRKAERVAQFTSYLQSIEFTEYRDLVPPLVRVSDDGTLGWLITQAVIAGTQRDETGDPIPVESVWAWVELYEKRDGEWVRVGEVSNRQPGE